jgi:hypothetical protein
MKWMSSPALARALFLALLLTGTAAAAEPGAWQIQDGNRLVIVEGDKAYAAGVALKVRQLQAATAWLVHWPESYQPPQSLVFLLKEDTVRRHFLQPPIPYEVHVDPYTPLGATIDAPNLSFVVAPRGSERAVEFTPLHNLYGTILLGRSPDVRNWPPCVRIGLAAMLTVTKVTDRNRLFIDGVVVGAYEPVNPAEFLDPSAAPPPQQTDADQRAYSCYLLASWYVTSPPEQRVALEDLFTKLGAWTPFADSVPAALGGSVREFTDRFRLYASQRRLHPTNYNIKTVLPGLEQDPPAPVPVPAERLETLLQQACMKLARCPKQASPPS